MRLLFNRISFPSSTLLTWVRERNLPWAMAETGLHGVSLLREAGASSVKAMRMRETDGLDGTLEILAWSSEPIAGGTGCAVETREIPLEAIAGQRLTWRLRCQPTIRRSGREIDAWVAERDKPEETRAKDRASAYRAWLGERVKGAEIQDLHVTRAGATRMELPGKPAFRKPVAELEGELLVTDAEAFALCLIRGIGRQRRLGFGLMLIGRA